MFRRSVADSNRCSWFCRPVTKPLIQPTISSGTTRNRTGDTRIFSPLLYQLSYGTILYYVRRMRLELTQPNGHYPLKVACLPISPPPQKELSVKLMYPDPGSNRDEFPHWCLRPARLPIPPSGQGTKTLEIPKGERKTGLEPATPTLARSCSTN